jgi:hypothetical protein
MQSQNTDICKSMDLLEGCHEFLKEYKEMVYRELFKLLRNLPMNFKWNEFQSVKRVRHVKRHFHYETRNQPVLTPEKKFENELFSTLLDTALMSSEEDSSKCIEMQKLGVSCTKSANCRKKRSLQNIVQIFSWFFPLVRMQISKELLYVIS